MLKVHGIAFSKAATVAYIFGRPCAARNRPCSTEENGDLESYSLYIDIAQLRHSKCYQRIGPIRTLTSSQLESGTRNGECCGNDLSQLYCNNLTSTSEKYCEGYLHL